MIKALFSCTVCALLLGTACTSPADIHQQPGQDASLQKQTNAQPSGIDSPETTVGASEIPPEHIGPPAEKDPVDNPVAIRTGVHNITLQWISWDRPGKVTIKKAGNGRYHIEGEQINKEDYLQINGFLTPVTPLKILFEGKLIYRVSHLNKGQPCDKSGPQEFLSTKGRKYWRMQAMNNCEGGMVTDYVDIYF